MEIFTLLFILAAGWVGRLVFERLRLPPLVGEILVGLIIGPPVLGLVGGVIKGVEVTGLIGKPIFEWTPAMDLLATLGIFFLMFHAGLTTDPKQLAGKMKHFVIMGTSGTIFPLIFGFLATWWITGEMWAAILVGVAISGTSMAVKVRWLDDLNLLRTKIGYAMMGSSIVDNILSFMVLSVVIKAVTAGGVGVLDIVKVVLTVAAFFAAVLLLGWWLYPKIGKFMCEPGEKSFVFALILGLLIAGIAHEIGIHLIVGAYLAGLLLREEILGKAAENLYTRFHTLSHGFFAPIFIVSVAFHVNLNVFVEYPILLVAIALAAFAGKMIGIYGASRLLGFEKKEALAMGWGMNSRGVVDMIFAIVGLEIGILTDVHISIFVVVAILTTLIAPIGVAHVLKIKSATSRKQSPR
ncbi:MAG: cation:proton antiporter [Candidatus Hadarchaeales archaeon]